MDPSPRDRLYRWLIEMILAYPLVTEREHPPDPPHNEWMPSGAELDRRRAVRAYLEMTHDEEREQLWERLDAWIARMNAGLLDGRDLVRDWAVEFFGDVPDEPPDVLLREMFGIDLGAVLREARLGARPGHAGDRDEDRARREVSTTDNVIWLFPRADEDGPGAEGSGDADGGAIARGSVAAGLPVDAASDRAPVWRSRLRWSGAGAFGALVAALAVAAVWPGEPGDPAGRSDALEPAPMAEVSLPVTDYEFATCEPAGRETPTREAGTSAPARRRAAEESFITDIDAVVVRRPDRATDVRIEVTEIDRASMPPAPARRRIRTVNRWRGYGLEFRIGDDASTRVAVEVD